MGLIDMSAAEAISRTLNSAPNSKIDPRLWLELSRCHAAIKEMAALTDATSNPVGGDYSGVPVNMYLQEQTIVTARAAQPILKYTPVKLALGGGELQAYWTVYSTNIMTRGDAVATEDVAVGAVGQFLLRGIAFAYVDDLTSANLAKNSSRLFSMANETVGHSYFSADAGNADSTLTFSRDYPVAGVYLHTYVVDTFLSTCLMYFNPERIWLDRTFGS